jgi:hypothetical protein
MMKYLLLAMVILFVLDPATAQVKKRIKKGHRNKSESQFALEKGEIEFDWELAHENNNPQLGTIIYPNLAVRYGISDRLEINTEINNVTAYSKGISPGVKTSGLEPVSFGINYLILKDSGNRPSLIFSGQVAIPWMTSTAFSAQYYAPTIELLAQQQTSKKNVVGLSGGLFWDGFSWAADFVYNLNDTYQFTPHWSLSLEIFGYLGKNRPLNYADAGVSYTVNQRLQFGCVAGFGLSSAAYTNYFALNGTWGFKKRK